MSETDQSPEITADTTPKPFVFVLMPFAESFEDVYRPGIKAAATDRGADGPVFGLDFGGFVCDSDSRTCAAD